MLIRTFHQGPGVDLSAKDKDFTLKDKDFTLKDKDQDLTTRTRTRT